MPVEKEEEKKYVILVDEDDQPKGVMEKQEAHEKGVLHRAFSVFIFNPAGELLIQKRAINKYHSGGLWANTCCSHPSPGESTPEAAKKRLEEEMGIVTSLQFAFSFVYNEPLKNGLREHELDHVFTGIFGGDPVINRGEVMDYQWKNTSELLQEIDRSPGEYAVWFRLCLARLLEFRGENR